MQKREEIESVSRKVLVLQGPNLNLLGQREPGLYGDISLEEIHIRMEEEARRFGLEIFFYQSNHEGALIDRIHEAKMEGIQGIIINAGGLTHTSVSLRDALSGVSIPYVEIHISNIHAREKFRHHSYLSEKASGIVVGFGVNGYFLALRGMADLLNGQDRSLDMRS